MSEDLFLGGLHLIWAGKRTWFWVGKFSFWSSLFSKFLSPLSKILRTLLVTPYYDVKPQLHGLAVNTLLFSLYLAVPILIWTKSLLIFRRKPFFFGFHLFLVRKKVPPRNPAPGATIFSITSGYVFLEWYAFDTGSVCCAHIGVFSCLAILA